MARLHGVDFVLKKYHGKRKISFARRHQQNKHDIQDWEDGCLNLAGTVTQISLPKEEVRMHRHLKGLNNPAIKSIENLQLVHGYGRCLWYMQNQCGYFLWEHGSSHNKVGGTTCLKETR